MFLDLRAKFQKLKKKIQNSRKKLNLWGANSPPVAPSDVKKMPGIHTTEIHFQNNITFIIDHWVIYSLEFFIDKIWKKNHSQN